MNIHKKIRQSIAWNTLEGLCYQVILLGHQLLLYKSLTPHLFGLVGMLFATTYFFASIISGGFDAAITPFFSKALLSKQNFRTIIIRPFIQHCLLMIGVSACIIVISFFSQKIFLLAHIPVNLLKIIGLLALSEGIHKLLKTVSQLAFKAKHVAFIELATLFCYTGSVWMGYMYGMPLSLELIFIPMLLTSISTTIMYVVVLYNGYISLSKNDITIFNDVADLHRNRIMNFCNQIGHAFFSSNFLVPWIAAHAGLAQAGIFKLISHVCYFISPILQRVFGFSSQALFAHVRDIKFIDRVKLMNMLHKKLMYTVYGVVIILTLNIKTIIGINGSTANNTPWPALILFMILLISENLIIVYEKFCIAEQKVHYLIGNTLFSCGALYFFTLLKPTTSIPVLLLGLIIIRVCSYCMIKYVIKDMTDTKIAVL